MSRFTLLLALVFCVSACRRQPDGHVDGAASVDIHVVVRDRQSGSPLSAAMITFYDFIEARVLAQTRAELAHGAKPTNRTPDGVRVQTDSRGQATLRCRFEAALLTRGASSNVVEILPRPDGLLVVERNGYVTQTTEMPALLPASPSMKALSTTLAVVELTPASR